MQIKNFFSSYYNSIKYTDISASEFKCFEHSSVSKLELPKHWSKYSNDLLVNIYFRKDDIPAILKTIPEKDVPAWLYPSCADEEALLKLPKPERYTSEISAREVFRRIAGAWTYWGYKNNYFFSEESAKVFFDEIQYIICAQIASPNSPQWFNTGLHWAYGISEEPQGYYYSETDNKAYESTNAYERPQTHSSFIQRVENNLVNKNGIYDLMYKEAKIFKYGSGSGTNFSNIAGKGEKLCGGGISTGVMSFLKISDASADIIRQGVPVKSGTKMVVLDADHPEIEDFINWKIKEDEKIVSMVTGSFIVKYVIDLIFSACKNYNGLPEHRYDHLVNPKLKNVIFLASNLMIPEKYIDRALSLAKQDIYDINFTIFSTAWESEVYKTVTGKNTATFVSLNNIFMDKCLKKEPWHLLNRFDGSSYKTIDAEEILNDLALSSWKTYNVGAMFIDTANDWNTCSSDGMIKSSTPSFEYLFLDDTACSLASINLLMLKDGKTIDIEKLEHIVHLLVIALDISITMAVFPSAKTAKQSSKYRSIGIGFGDAATLLMTLGIPYDSDMGRSLISFISAYITGYAYKVSAVLAKKKQPFMAFSNNQKRMQKVINNHISAVNNSNNYDGLFILPSAPIVVDGTHIHKDHYDKLVTLWNEVKDFADSTGFRNAQVTCIAPNSNTSFILGCNTPALHPETSLVKYYTAKNGEYKRDVTPYVLEALIALGYSEEDIDNIKYYLMGRKSLQNAPFINTKSLISLGFTQEIIDKIDLSLLSTYNIEFSFNRYIIGDDFCRDVLKLDLTKLKNPNFSLLEALGFTKREITEANYYVNGYLNLENSPIIKKEHLPIFDTNQVFGSGTRYISSKSHIKMVAAVQPFITGGISKTLVLPFHASVKDCKDMYIYAWKKGLKAISITREGNMLHQPLKQTLFGNNILDKVDLLNLFLRKDIPKIVEQFAVIKDIPERRQHNIIKKISKYLAEYFIRKKANIPNKKRIKESTINDNKISLTSVEKGDGTLTEIFIDVDNYDIAFNNLVNCFAKAVSIGLQHGIPLENFVEDFVALEFEPQGVVKGHNYINHTSSIVDYVFRDLAITYLNRYDLSDKNSKNNKIKE